MKLLKKLKNIEKTHLLNKSDFTFTKMIIFALDKYLK